MYCPLIQKIEVLRLEKRLDDSLLYLRDAMPEYSTFAFDMEPEMRVDNSVVPINPIKVIETLFFYQNYYFHLPHLLWFFLL